MAQQASSGDTVAIHYTGRLNDGTVFDTSEGRDPLEFTIGAGEVIPGFDTLVTGLSVGEKRTGTIPAAEAYGERRDDLMMEVERSSFPDDMELEVGMELYAQSEDGVPHAVVVAGLTDTHAVVDFNHVLAGEDLTFDVELVEIKGGEKKSGLIITDF